MKKWISLRNHSRMNYMNFKNILNISLTLQEDKPFCLQLRIFGHNLAYACCYERVYMSINAMCMCVYVCVCTYVYMYGYSCTCTIVLKR